jgi:hypothetical protein
MTLFNLVCVLKHARPRANLGLRRNLDMPRHLENAGIAFGIVVAKIVAA